MIRRRRRQPGTRRGFTLIESMATVSVLGILGSVASFIIFDAVDGYMDAATSAQIHAEISIALDRVVREVRRIELDSGASGVAPNIDDVTGSSMIWKDSDSDAYRIQLTGSTLELQVDGGPTAVLLGDVTTFSVKTYDEDNVQLASVLTGAACDPIRRVLLEVTCQRSSITESLRTRIFIRSTMDGAQ